MKSQLEGTISISLLKGIIDLMQTVKVATDNAVKTVIDEAKIEGIANAARQSATEVAYLNLFKQVIQDATVKAAPMLKQISDDFFKILVEAFGEAIKEKIEEKLNIKS